MEDYLIDVPVQLNVWIRPDCQSRQLEVIVKARPSIIFIVSDGGRCEEEWDKIYQNRAMIEKGITWNCKVYKLYEKKNIGVKSMIMKTHEFVWAKVDQCIFLEDDIIPTVSFFRYCKELLDKYKDDTRISVICGMNHLGICNHVTSDYFFSKQGSIWGYALWKRTYEEFYKYGYENDDYVWNALALNMKRDKELWELVCEIKKDKERYFSPMEFFMEMSVYLQNQLMIIPKKNMITCYGANESSHASDSIKRLPRGVRRVFFMDAYEQDFPLKHPEFIIPDGVYEKKRNRIVARNHPILTQIRRIERAIYVMLDGDFRYIWTKAKR